MRRLASDEDFLGDSELETFRGYATLGDELAHIVQELLVQEMVSQGAEGDTDLRVAAGGKRGKVPAQMREDGAG